MHVSNRFSLSLAASVTLALSACGGSGGSDPATPPVVANPPPVALPTVPTISLSGLVTDMPIPNATVVVTVNGQSFTAPLPTAIDGSYTVDIQSDDPDALVSIDAFDPNGPARFSAIVDSFSGIEANADADGAVEDVNVTNVTTAQAVLALRLTSDGSIDSVAELREVAARVDTQDMLELSAAIKLVVESIAGVTLPNGVDNTLDLAEAIVGGTSTFLADVEASAPGALGSAVDLVLSDGNATIAFTAATAAGVYVAQDGMAIFALLPQGYGFTVAQDRDGVAGFDWEINADGSLDLIYFGAESYSESITLLGRTGDVVNVVVRESDESGPGEPATAAFFAFDGSFDSQSLVGTYSTLNAPGELTVFTDGGFGYDIDLATGVQGDDFDFAIDDDGMLRVFDADGTVKNVRKLAGSTSNNLRLLVWETRPDGTVADLALIDALRSDALPGAGDSGATALLLAGNTYALTESDELALFTFGASGGFTEISQYQGAQTWEIGEESGTWSVSASGTISTLFPGDDTAGGATVVQGLGQDFMVVQTDDGETLQVTRIVPLDVALLAGSFSIQDDVTGTVSDTVRFNADFTGTYVGDDGVAETFAWGLGSSGRLVIETAGESDFDSETVTFYLLAGGSVDLLRFVAVHRVNGALRPAGAGNAADALELLTLVRNSANGL